MKLFKRLTLCTVLILCSISASAFVFAAENSDGVTIFYNYNNGGSSSGEVQVTYFSSTYYNSYSGDVVIPETVTYNGNTYTVTAIGMYAFYGCTSLTSVTIPESVTSIGTAAFYGCTSLTSVTIPESVTSINGEAFCGCSGLTSVTIPESVTSINNRTFYGCSGLTSVTIGENVTSIGQSAFYQCTSLTSVTIPESVTSINSQAFSNCTSLTTLILEDGEETLTLSTSSTHTPFTNCPIKTLYFGRNISYSGNYSPFRDNKSLTSLTIGESVTAIPDYTFYGCTGPSGPLTIGNSVTSIGTYAFYGCSGLTGTLTIPNVTSIGTYAFYNCKGLIDTLTIPNGITTINKYAFYGCSGLTEVIISESVTSIGQSAFYQCTSLNSITIPNSVTSIGDYAFYGCSGLTSVTIPESVTSIGGGAFHNCTGLTEVDFNATACTSAGSSTNPIFGECKNLMTAYIGDNVISIPSYLFYNCTELAEISIPESVTSIEDDAFGKCSSLWSISNISKTQLTSKMKITSNISGAESGIVYDDTFYDVDDEGYYTFTNLIPGNSYSYYFGIMLPNDSYSYHSNSRSVTTTSINPKITQISLTPETFFATGSYTEGDAVVTEVGFTDYETDGTHLSLYNLEPNTEYTIEYYVRASGNKFTTSTTFKTPAVEFTTLAAKATSNTVALIAATTNLSDDAVGAGFEWRRNDAPSTMPSNQAECPVIDGELTGTLNGLSSNTYYDYRPYYTSEGGVSYYGDWITFITADAYVYFEPVARTYEASNVTESSAYLKGYAVQGSDAITSQGFEYWAESSAKAVKRASSSDDATKVEVSGQMMIATIEDLSPGTTYSYRVYVTTAVGTTYGETQSFTTIESTGISNTIIGETEVYEVARYTMDGRKINTPQKGINIIRYSDGTAKKVLVK